MSARLTYAPYRLLELGHTIAVSRELYRAMLLVAGAIPAHAYPSFGVVTILSGFITTTVQVRQPILLDTFTDRSLPLSHSDRLLSIFNSDPTWALTAFLFIPRVHCAPLTVPIHWYIDGACRACTLCDVHIHRLRGCRRQARRRPKPALRARDHHFASELCGHRCDHRHGDARLPRAQARAVAEVCFLPTSFDRSGRVLIYDFSG